MHLRFSRNLWLTALSGLAILTLATPPATAQDGLAPAGFSSVWPLKKRCEPQPVRQEISKGTCPPHQKMRVSFSDDGHDRSRTLANDE